MQLLSPVLSEPYISLWVRVVYSREDPLQPPSSRPYDFSKSTKRLAQKVLGRNNSLLGSHDLDTVHWLKSKHIQWAIQKNGIQTTSNHDISNPKRKIFNIKQGQ